MTLDGSGSSDPEGTTLTYTWDFSDGTSGNGVTPTHTYTAQETYTATLTVTDIAGATASDAAVVTVSPANIPPVANNDPYTMKSRSTLNVAAPGPLGNNTGGDGNPLTAVLVAAPSRGKLTLNPNGSFTYTSPGNFTGTVTFTIRANDGVADSNDLATVTITVTR